MARTLFARPFARSILGISDFHDLAKHTPGARTAYSTEKSFVLDEGPRSIFKDLQGRFGVENHPKMQDAAPVPNISSTLCIGGVYECAFA